MEVEKVFRKVPLSERLPPLDIYVPMVDDHGEIMMYRRFETPVYVSPFQLDSPPTYISYSLRDLSTDNTPNDNNPLVYWLEEITIDELITTSERLKYLVDVLRTE